MSGSAAPKVGPRKGSLRDLLPRLFREKKLGAVGLIIVLVFFLVGVFADVLATHDLRDQNLRRALEGPSAEFPLGTDQFGRDLLTRVIHGARVSMIVGVGAVAIGLVIALFFGLLSGYWVGTFDLVVQRFVDAWLTFPWLFIVLTVMSLLGQGMVPMIVVLGAFTGIGNIRTVRGVVLGTKEHPYVEAARAVGCPTWRILLSHVLPQVWPPVIVVFTISLGAVILSESTISFLGFGIPPPQPSWGGMLSLEGRRYMERAPLLAIWPGLSLAIVVFGINMFGDALRDLLDPRLSGGTGRIGAANVQQAAEPPGQAPERS